MKTKELVVEESQARRLYKTASSELKEMLETTFGKEFFIQKITDRIKTYEDACIELGEQSIDENRLAKSLLTPDEILLRKIKTITKALNEGWEPDWRDSDQYKHYPYFNMSSGAFVFSDADCAYSICVRVTPRAFALKIAGWPNMQENNFSNYTQTIFFIINNRRKA